VLNTSYEVYGTKTRPVVVRVNTVSSTLTLPAMHILRLAFHSFSLVRRAMRIPACLILDAKPRRAWSHVNFRDNSRALTDLRLYLVSAHLYDWCAATSLCYLPRPHRALPLRRGSCLGRFVCPIHRCGLRCCPSRRSMQDSERLLSAFGNGRARLTRCAPYDQISSAYQ